MRRCSRELSCARKRADPPAASTLDASRADSKATASRQRWAKYVKLPLIARPLLSTDFFLVNDLLSKSKTESMPEFSSTRSPGWMGKSRLGQEVLSLAAPPQPAHPLPRLVELAPKGSSPVHPKPAARTPPAVPCVLNKSPSPGRRTNNAEKKVHHGGGAAARPRPASLRQLTAHARCRCRRIT